MAVKANNCEETPTLSAQSNFTKAYRKMNEKMARITVFASQR